MLIRTVSLAVGVLGAIIGAQLPELMQQYQQRLGGAADEVAIIVDRFDRDAAANNMSRGDALAQLHVSGDDLVRRRGADMEINIERLAQLKQQSEEMSGDYLSRTVYFIGHADSALLNETLKVFKPAVPTTVEGLFSALAGLVAGWWVVRLIAWPFRRWNEMRARGNARRTQGR
ncbi:MAG: DUF2937 family protein [Parvibaculaceae bacterium]